jgi:hypothetical protein
MPESSDEIEEYNKKKRVIIGHVKEIVERKLSLTFKICELFDVMNKNHDKLFPLHV